MVALGSALIAEALYSPIKYKPSKEVTLLKATYICPRALFKQIETDNNFFKLFHMNFVNRAGIRGYCVLFISGEDNFVVFTFIIASTLSIGMQLFCLANVSVPILFKPALSSSNLIYILVTA